MLKYAQRGMTMIRIRLSRLLGEKRWTQATLARKTGIRPNTINELYHELTDRVNLTQLESICKALGCRLGDLLEETEDRTDVR